MDAEPLVAPYDVGEVLDSVTSAWRKPAPITIDAVDAGDEAPFALASDVEGFLASLRREQVRFLDAISAARLELSNEPGQLARAAVLQGRLTQRFLDAQRSILRGRAAVDAKVARIAEDTEAIVASTGATGASGRAVCERSGDDVRALLDLAEPADHVGRTSSDTDAFAWVIDAAFEFDQPEGATAEQQLRTLLDDWWQAEVQECQAGIDDAYARAAMRLHVARTYAGESFERPANVQRLGPPTTPPVPHLAPPAPVLAPPAPVFAPPELTTGSIEPATLVPRSLLAQLDAVDHEGLDSLIESLLDALGTPPTHELPPGAVRAVAAIGPGQSSPSTSAAYDGASDDFWPTRRRWPQRLARHWVIAHVLFPMVSVVGALVVVLAMTG